MYAAGHAPGNLRCHGDAESVWGYCQRSDKRPDWGLGLLPSSNIGTDYAMFEAVHGSAPDIAGKHIANPTALLWSACMMLEHLQEGECAANIRKAVDAVLMEQKYLTPDLHGSSTTEEYRDAVIAKLS